MFEKHSHRNTSVSWVCFGAVAGQTPRQAKETFLFCSSLHTGRASDLCRQDHTKIADCCRSLSPLLYSPHCWDFLETGEIIKFSFPPFPPLLSRSQSPACLPGMLTEPFWGQVVSSSSHKGQNLGTLRDSLNLLSLHKALGSPTWILLVTTITIHLAPLPWGI